MAKKKHVQETTIENYYDLKTDKIDELVAALKGDDLDDTEAPTTDIEEITGETVNSKSRKKRNFDPYRRDKLASIPVWLKAIFIKWWFAGAVCYFVNMGLGLYIPSFIDLMILDGLLYGVLVDIIVNPLFRMMESDKREFDYYTMFPFPVKHFWTFFANMFYYVIVFFGVMLCYAGVNEFITFAAVEPLLFGVFAVIVDMALIGIKDLIVFLVKKAMRKEKINDV